MFIYAVDRNPYFPYVLEVLEIELTFHIRMCLRKSEIDLESAQISENSDCSGGHRPGLVVYSAIRR